MPDVLFILLLALVIFGPKKLPEIARQIGKLMAQVRMMSNDVKRQLETEILKMELEEKEKKPAGDAKDLETSDQRGRADARPQSPRS